MLKHDHFSHAADQKSAQCADPAVPECANYSRQSKTHEDCEQMNVPMLPHHQRIFFQIGYVIERWLRRQLKQQPTNVRMKKSLADIVGIVVMVDMFVVPAVIARPEQD